MPAHLPNAFIAIEDRRFRFHHGIDPVGLFRAVLANALHRGISQGGSTRRDNHFCQIRTT